MFLGYGLARAFIKLKSYSFERYDDRLIGGECIIFKFSLEELS